MRVAYFVCTDFKTEEASGRMGFVKFAVGFIFGGCFLVVVVVEEVDEKVFFPCVILIFSFCVY